MNIRLGEIANSPKRCDEDTVKRFVHIVRVSRDVMFVGVEGYIGQGKDIRNKTSVSLSLNVRQCILV